MLGRVFGRKNRSVVAVTTTIAGCCCCKWVVVVVVLSLPPLRRYGKKVERRLHLLGQVSLEAVQVACRLVRRLFRKPRCPQVIRCFCEERAQRYTTVVAAIDRVCGQLQNVSNQAETFSALARRLVAPLQAQGDIVIVNVVAVVIIVIVPIHRGFCCSSHSGSLFSIVDAGTTTCFRRRRRIRRQGRGGTPTGGM